MSFKLKIYENTGEFIVKMNLAKICTNAVYVLRLRVSIVNVLVLI